MLLIIIMAMRLFITQEETDKNRLLADKFSGCNIVRRTQSRLFPEEPTLFESTRDTQFTMRINEIDSRSDRLRKTVRWPIGINQFGSCERQVESVSHFFENEMMKPDGGLLFDEIDLASAQVAFDINESQANPFGGLSNDLILSVGGPEKGLPFHNHAAAWQTVISGRKLFLFLPPLPLNQTTVKSDWTPRFACARPMPHAFLTYFCHACRDQQMLEKLFLPLPSHLIRRTLGEVLRAKPMLAQLLQHCTVNPGETVFIPCNYYHATINLEATVAIGKQFQRDAGVAPACPPDHFGCGVVGLASITY